jgi:hypothetical protein
MSKAVPAAKPTSSKPASETTTSLFADTVKSGGNANPAPASNPAANKPVSKPSNVGPTTGAEATTKIDSSALTSSAPPPWQRVASDVRHAEEQLESTSAEATTRFEDWGYQRSPRSDAYQPLADNSLNVYPPAGAGAVTAGQLGGDPAGRTTVNLGVGAATTSPRAGTPSVGTRAPSARRRPGRGPRRASLQVKRVDPWSVLKLAFVLSVALFFVWLVAVGVLYGVLDGMGVWDKLNGTYTEFAQNTSGGGGGPLITASRVFGIAAIIGAINIVLITALATVGAFVYNVSADLAGGLEITLAERE